MSQPPSRFAQIFLSIFILAGVIAVGCGVWMLVQSLRSERWPTTEGVILTAKMQRHSGNKGGSTYSAEIAYDFQVMGSHYLGTRLAFGATSSSTSYAQGILNRYPIGQKVLVHYSPSNPQEAVLETGIHGGTWICFGAGTVFVLMGVMFLKIISAQNRVEQAAGATSSRYIKLDQPPVLMGVIFIVMGSFAFFMEPAGGTPNWIAYAAGGFFVLIGLFILAYRLEKKVYSQILLYAAVLAFLVIFHWVSFGMGERIGTTSSPLSHTKGANVKPFFAVFTIIIDLLMLAGLVQWLAKRRKD